jgi:mono/diheme cytochrome c family protein
MGVLPNSLRRPVLRWALIISLPLVCGVVAILYFTDPSPNKPEDRNAPAPAPGAVAVGNPGKELYGNFCAACHGETGDGNGPAARFLYPKPRNFREARFRLVSTVNLMPSDADIFNVITRGMPGSAMVSFAHLSTADRQALVAYVRHLTITGLVDKHRADLGENPNPAELAELEQEIAESRAPGEALQAPKLPAPGPESVARGAQLYKSEACASCHGATGKGDGVQEQRDDIGMVIRPRDFTQGVFKGEHDPRQLFTRLRLGMPGTPMPAFPNLKPADAGDLINFVLSLSSPEARAKAEHKRVHLVARRLSGSLTGDVPEEEWRRCQDVAVVVSPLWWRNFDSPDLHVRALHDGESLALCLTWKDTTRNDQPVRPQDFEDMAAVQLFQGSPEPFLGMGAADKPVDCWLWRASWGAGPGQVADVDTLYPNMSVDLYPFEKAGPGSRQHTPENQPDEFLTARAAGNQLADASRDFTGGNLQARGFGTLTMRPRVSQVVSARGTWKDGAWTVVLRRPMKVDPQAGLPLAPGQKLSIAFAIWDGAAGDRNGQKLISVWHDLQLE